MKYLVLVLCVFLASLSLKAQAQQLPCVNQDTLVVLWTSAEKAQAMDMILWYTSYAKSQDWWKEIVIITWGPSNDIIANDDEVKGKVSEMIKNGVKFLACKGCADKNSIAESLLDVGIEVIYVGDELTGFLKGGYPILSF